MVTAIAFTSTVVLLSRVLSADAATELSVILIENALPVSFNPASVVISPSEIDAVITPVVSAARALALAVIITPVTNMLIPE